MAKVTKKQLASEIEYSQRWYKSVHIVWAVACIVVLALLILFNRLVIHGVWESTWLPRSSQTVQDLPLYARLIRIAVVIGLVPLFYVTVAGLANVTRIEVTRSKIAIACSPLPWFGRSELPGDRLEAIRVNEHPKGRKFLYSVSAILPGPSSVVLLKDIEKAEEAESIKADIESFMNVGQS